MKRLLKVALFLWLLGEWYTRGGKEMLFGESDEGDGRWQEQDVLRTKVVLPVEVRAVQVGTVIENARGQEVGIVVRTVPHEGGTEVTLDYERRLLGWPINVALSQAHDMARKRLTPSA